VRLIAFESGRAWPDWPLSTAALAGVLAEIVAAPPPAPIEYARRLIVETEMTHLGGMAAESEIGELRDLVRLRELEIQQLAARRPSKPRLVERILWVARNEGAAGIRRRVVGASRAADVLAARRRWLAATLEPTTRAGLVIPALDRPGRRWLQSLVRTAQLTTENRRLCIVRRRRGWLSCRYADGRITLDGMGDPALIDRETEHIFHFAFAPSAGDVVVDAGAGVGTEVLLFSRLVGPRGKVVAIEAHPESFRRLQAIVALNRLSNVVAVHAAVADAAGTIEISDYAEPVLNTTVGVTGRGIPVRAETLDRLLAELHVDRATFLKMNIEGGEVDALRGFREGLLRAESVAIGCHDFLAEDGRGSEAMRTKASVRQLVEAAGFGIATRDEHELPWVRDYVYGVRRRAEREGEESAAPPYVAPTSSE
jgi:FkbM family methyltransferase